MYVLYILILKMHNRLGENYMSPLENTFGDFTLELYICRSFTLHPSFSSHTALFSILIIFGFTLLFSTFPPFWILVKAYLTFWCVKPFHISDDENHSFHYQMVSKLAYINIICSRVFIPHSILEVNITFPQKVILNIWAHEDDADGKANAKI